MYLSLFYNYYTLNFKICQIINFDCILYTIRIMKKDTLVRAFYRITP